MKKSRTVEVPVIKTKSKIKCILDSISKPKTANRVSKETGIPLFTTKSRLSELVSEGMVISKKCPCCDIGTMYQRADKDVL